MAKVVTVFGVDTPPGAAVAHSLSRRGYKVRGVSLGGDIPVPPTIENVRCDIRTVESLTEAVSGSVGVFVHTFSDFKVPDFAFKEIDIGRKIADACECARVPHVVFCTQPHTLVLASLGARHMCAKAELEQYFCLKRLPLTFIILPVFYEDLLSTLAPAFEQPNVFRFELPLGEDFPLDMISVEDIGPAVDTIFNNPATFIIADPVYPVKTSLRFCGDKLLRHEIADDLSHFLRSLHFKDKPITNHQYRCPENYNGSRRFPWSEDYANMFQFLQRVRWDHKHGVASTQRLNPNLLGYQEWVKQNVSDLETAFSEYGDGERLQWWFQRLYKK